MEPTVLSGVPLRLTGMHRHPVAQESDLPNRRFVGVRGLDKKLEALVLKYNFLIGVLGQYPRADLGRLAHH